MEPGLRATSRLFEEDWPIDARDPTRHVRRHRKLDCPKYDLCLDVAVYLAWPSFSCLDCNGEGPDDRLLLAVMKQIERNIDPFDERNRPVLLKEYFIPRTARRS